MKVLAGEGNFDSDVEDKADAVASGAKAKRQAKMSQKQGADGRSKMTTLTKISKLVSRILNV